MLCLAQELARLGLPLLREADLHPSPHPRPFLTPLSHRHLQWPELMCRRFGGEAHQSPWSPTVTVAPGLSPLELPR